MAANILSFSSRRRPICREDGRGEAEGLGLTYATEQVRLAEAETAALQEAARTQHVTLNTLVQGAWALLLSRYSREQDVLFGITVAGRPAELPGVETMVGLFINSLPLRVAVAPNARVGEWLRARTAQPVVVA